MDFLIDVGWHFMQSLLVIINSIVSTGFITLPFQPKTGQLRRWTFTVYLQEIGALTDSTGKLKSPKTTLLNKQLPHLDLAGQQLTCNTLLSNTSLIIIDVYQSEIVIFQSLPTHDLKLFLIATNSYISIVTNRQLLLSSFTISDSPTLSISFSLTFFFFSSHLMP